MVRATAMTSWADFAAAEPEFAARVEERFRRQKHMTLATLRRDGSPRISGTEIMFEDGELKLGMMVGSLKARDLSRDGRLALHSPTVDPPPGNDAGWPGEAKIAGRGIDVTPADSSDAVWFRIDI